MEQKVLNKLEFNKIIEKLIECAVSPMAKEACGDLVPVTELEDIIYAQKETSEAVSMLLKKGSIPLGSLKDIRGSLKRTAIGGVLSIGELLRIGDTLRAANNVKRYSRDDRDKNSYETLEQLFDDIEPLTHIQREIEGCIASEEMIDDNATSELRNIRREIRSTHERVKQQLHSIVHSNTYKNMLQDNVVTMRGDRYCIPIKQEYRGSFKGMIHDQSTSGSTLFIEPMAVVQQNNKLRELYIKEKAEVEKILRMLSGLVTESQEEMTYTLAALTKLDFIFAKGNLALKMNAIKPRFNDRGYINIKKARHPLLNKDEVVPIDIYVGKDFTTLVVTGPNTGGKTVTLKTIGLFTLMGQAGLHIPAFDNSELAVFSNVYADIGDEQSIEQSLSTFSSHMVNIVKILNEVTYDSLVLFDELGAGTDPTEGAALAMAILQSLHKRGIRTVATTHYSELKVYALSTEGVENASCEFDVDTLRPTYRLLIGIPGKSNAFAISQKLGLTNDIIGQAKELIEHNDLRFEDLITDLEISKKSVEYEQERAKRYRREAEDLKKKVEAERQKIQQQKDKIIKQAREDAHKTLQQAKEDADEIIQKLNKATKQNIRDISIKEYENDRAKLREKIGDLEGKLSDSFKNRNINKKVPKNLKPGDKVYLHTFEQEAIAQTKPDAKGDVMVQAGIMKIKVNIKDISLVGEKKTTKNPYQKSTKRKIDLTKTQGIRTEIDLRGKTVEEALGEVDKYIDDAYLSNLTQVTLIHGKGTGVLRAAVQKYLKGNKHVESYRLGNYGEGESGVTIVELKKS